MKLIKAKNANKIATKNLTQLKIDFGISRIANSIQHSIVDGKFVAKVELKNIADKKSLKKIKLKLTDGGYTVLAKIIESQNCSELIISWKNHGNIVLNAVENFIYLKNQDLFNQLELVYDFKYLNSATSKRVHAKLDIVNKTVKFIKLNKSQQVLPGIKLTQKLVDLNLIEKKNYLTCDVELLKQFKMRFNGFEEFFQKNREYKIAQIDFLNCKIKYFEMTNPEFEERLASNCQLMQQIKLWNLHKKIDVIHCNIETFSEYSTTYFQKFEGVGNRLKEQEIVKIDFANKSIKYKQTTTNKLLPKLIVEEQIVIWNLKSEEIWKPQKIEKQKFGRVSGSNDIDNGCNDIHKLPKPKVLRSLVVYCSIETFLKHSSKFVKFGVALHYVMYFDNFQKLKMPSNVDTHAKIDFINMTIDFGNYKNMNITTEDQLIKLIDKYVVNGRKRFVNVDVNLLKKYYDKFENFNKFSPISAYSDLATFAKIDFTKQNIIVSTDENSEFETSEFDFEKQLKLWNL